MPTARLTTVNLNYLQLGDRAGFDRDLVMVHGLATNLAFWYQLAESFSSKYRVTLFDLRGHGRSSMPQDGYTPKQMAEDLKELIDVLEIEKAVFLGHSFGGSVVLNFACQYPEKIDRLILADVRLKLLQPQQKPKDWLNWERLQPILEEAGINLDEHETEAGYRLLTEVARSQVRDDFTLPQSLSNLFPQGSKRTAQQWLKLLDTTNAWVDFVGPENITLEQLQQFNKPTLAIYGDRSPTLPTARALKQILSDLKFELVANAGHFFPVSQPEKLATAVENFLMTTVQT